MKFSVIIYPLGCLALAIRTQRLQSPLENATGQFNPDWLTPTFNYHTLDFFQPSSTPVIAATDLKTQAAIASPWPTAAFASVSVADATDISFGKPAVQNLRVDDGSFSRPAGAASEVPTAVKFYACLSVSWNTLFWHMKYKALSTDFLFKLSIVMVYYIVLFVLKFT